MAEQIQSRIDIEVRTKGPDPEAVARGLDKLAQSEGNVVQITEEMRKVREREAAALDRRAKLLDADYRAMKRAEDTEKLLARARASGLEGTLAYERAQIGLAKTQEKLSASMDSMIGRLTKYNSMIGRLDQWNAFQKGAQDSIKPLDEMTRKMGDFYEKTTSMIGRLDQWGAAAARAAAEANKPFDAMIMKLGEWDRQTNSMIGRLNTWSAGVAKAMEQANRPLDAISAKMTAFYQTTTSMVGRLDAWTAAVKRLNEEANKPIAPASPMAAAMGESFRQSTSMSGRLSSWRAMEAYRQEQANRPVSPMAAAMSANFAQSTSMVGRLDAWSTAQKRLTTETTATGNAAVLTSAKWANLSQQFQDVFVMIASGMSPMTTLIQQGPQIADVFATSKGGAGAALKEFGAVALRVATHPLTLMAAGAVTAAAAMYQWQRSVDALTISLNGLGRASGLTAEGASAMADRAARSAGVSVSSARGLAAQYLGAGVSGGSIGGAIGMTRDFGRKFGMTNEDAGTMLAGALADPARGAEELSRKLGLLSFAQREQIIQTANMGDRAGATAKLVAALQEKLKTLEDPTWNISRAFDNLKNKALDFLSLIGRGLFGGEVENELARQERVRQAQQNMVAGRLDEALTRQLGLDKVANDAAFAAREITAQTYAQREAVAMEKARVQTLRDTKDATMATMAAEAERLRLLAEAQRKVDDYSRSGARDRAISGARTPFARGRMQIIQEGEELLRQIPTTAPAPAPRRVRAPAPANDVGALSGGTQSLIAEAQRRGLEPTEANFQKLMDEGVGANKFRGRMVRMDEGFTQSTVNVPNINRAALEKQARAETQARLRAYEQTQQREFTDRVNLDLEAQNRLLNANAEAFGKSAGEIERARKEQELINQAKSQGLPMTESLTRAIKDEADRYGELAQRQEDMQRSQQRVIENFDLVRSSAADSLSSFASDILRGKSALDSLNGSLMNIADRLISLASSRAIEQIFGPMGKANLGGGGSIFSSLLSVIALDTGGVIGVHGRPMKAPVSAFRGAPSYDKGGTIGSPVPMIGHVGEIVLNAAMQRNTAAALRGGGGGGVTIIDQRGANAPAVETRETTDNMGRRRTEVVIRETVAQAVASPQGQSSIGNNFAVRPRVARR